MSENVARKAIASWSVE